MQNIGRFGLDWAGKITDQKSKTEYEMLNVILFDKHDKQVGKKTFYTSDDIKLRIFRLHEWDEPQIRKLYELPEYTKITQSSIYEISPKHDGEVVSVSTHDIYVDMQDLIDNIPGIMKAASKRDSDALENFLWSLPKKIIRK